MNSNYSSKLETIPEKTLNRFRIVYNMCQFISKHSFKGIWRLLYWLIQCLIPKPKGKTIIQTLYGFNIIVNPIVDQGIDRSIYYFGTYEPGTLHIISKCIKTGDSFIDVGSNIGLITLYAASLVGESGKIYSFEPFNNTFNILLENIKLNNYNNIVPINLALGAKKERRSIFQKIKESRGSASLINPKNSSSANQVFVETLDNFITNNEISQIRMIKIDVEGWELEVLKGSRSILEDTNAPIICIEYSRLHPNLGQLFDIYQFILSINDIHIYKLRKGKESISKLIRITDKRNLPKHDNLFCFLPEHLQEVEKTLL